jgi:hypothetical protein
MTDDVEHLLKCLFAICVFSFCEMSLWFICPFKKNWVVYFTVLLYALHIFLPIVVCPLFLLLVSLESLFIVSLQNFFILIVSNLLLYCIINHILGAIWTLYPTQVHRRLSPVFSSRNFTVLGFMIHFKLIFIYDVGYGSKFIFYVWISNCSNIICWRLFFLYHVP